MAADRNMNGDTDDDNDDVEEEDHTTNTNPRPVTARRVTGPICDDPEATYDTDFMLGEYVVDEETLRNVMGESHRQTDDTGVAIVVREGRALVEDVYIEDGLSIADVNPGYPDDDPVVDVVFVETLDRMFGAWRKEWQRHTLDWRLAEYKDEWGVPIRTYGYPASRLRPADDVTDLDFDGLPQ